MKTVSTTFKGLTRILLLMFAFASAGLLVACDEQGPAEQAGEKMDEAAEQMNDAVDAMDSEGPAEEAGKAIDNAVDDAASSVEEMTDDSATQ